MEVIDKHPIDSSILAGFLSPSCLGLVKCAVFGVSVGCLEGVWGLSE